MRKFPVIVALVLIIIGGAYALVANLLPDNNQFPRIPTGNGTVGGAIAKILGITDLANYLGDGTVANTNMLSGLTADKLLKGNKCTNLTDVWIKTDATGKPVCGSNGGMLATTIGTINTIVGTVTAYRADGTTKILTGSDPILEGDIIQTSPGAAITIAFSDLSLIRLDGGSTVSLDTGVNPSSGESIAYAILNNGGLWGRVLTETGGYYIGNNDIVAGVRGTSISYERDRSFNNPSITPSGTGWIITSRPSVQGEIKVIHSTKSGVTLECRDGSTKFVGTGRLIQLPASSPGGGSMCSTVSSSSMPTLYDNSTNSGIARNTAADLNYMVGLLYKSEYSTKYSRIQKEIDVTKPKDAATRNSVCPEASIIVNTYWDVFSGSEMGPCQSALAIANYADNTVRSANMYFSGGQSMSPGTLTSSPLVSAGNWIRDDGNLGGRKCDNSNHLNMPFFVNSSTFSAHPNDWNQLRSNVGCSGCSGLYLTNARVIQCNNPSGTQWQKNQYAGDLYGIYDQNLGSPETGISIPATTQYISYPLPLLTGKIGSLAGKTVTIKLSGTPSTNNAGVLDIGVCNVKWKTSGGWTSTSPSICQITSSPTSGNNIQIKINGTPTAFYIGNLASFANPINSTILSMSISN